MRVLLIDPPFYRFVGFYNRYFPLGPAYLAAVLRDDHEVRVYDADCNVDGDLDINYSRLEEKYALYIDAINTPTHPVWEEVRRTIKQFRPEVVGISAMTPKVAAAFRVAELCKDYDPTMPVILGGPHATDKPEESIRISKSLDFVIANEAEVSFQRLLHQLQNGKEEFAGIGGLAFRSNGRIRLSPPAAPIEDLDTVPFPARDLLMGLDSYSSEDMGMLLTSRGCPFGCTFCSVGNRRVRYRSVENVLDEMREVNRRYGTVQFTFKDDIFTLDRKRVEAFCRKLLEEGPKVKWDCNSRVRLVDAELLALMKRAGCNSLKVGVESGSPRILDSMEKGITREHVRTAARQIRKAGIHWTGYFMMGIPTETREDMLQTLEFMREIKPDYASLSVYEPFPNTGLYDLGVEIGLVEPDRTLEEYYRIPPKYIFVKDMTRRIDTMSDEEFREVEGFMKGAFDSYNMGLPRVAKRALARLHVYTHDWRILWGDLKKYLSMVRRHRGRRDRSFDYHRKLARS
jgi:radical SAM superfamily enzyme YgiQ (UPF0313 family)